MSDDKKATSIIYPVILIIITLILAGTVYLFVSGSERDQKTSGESDIIILDGHFEEWQFRSPVYSDKSGDNLGDTIDFTSIYIDNDQDYLYIRMELNKETNLQNGSNLVLYIDADNDLTTGEEFNGLGADLVYDLGNRRGHFYHHGMRKPLTHDLIGLITMPTVTSDTFEIGIARTNLPGDTPVFPSSEIRVALAHNVDGGDQVPDSGENVSHTFSEETVSPPDSISLDKHDPSAIRIVSWNVLKDGFLKEDRMEHFYNVLQAVKPDIINLQEMYVTQAPDIQAQIEAWFPELEWYVHKMGDLVTISRYPIVEPKDGRLPVISSASPVLIQLPDEKQLLIINTHYRCCDQDDIRQREIDETMALIRDIRTPGDRVDLLPDTPIIILGDMNLVGYAQQVKSLLTGDIVNEGRYGEDFDPDWDDSSLTDLLTRHTETRHVYTWRDEETSFTPGRLDYIIYTDSVLNVRKHYILDTAELSAEKLAKYGLEAEDSFLATDHLIFVVDFILK